MTRAFTHDQKARACRRIGRLPARWHEPRHVPTLSDIDYLHALQDHTEREVTELRAERAALITQAREKTTRIRHLLDAYAGATK